MKRTKIKHLAILLLMTISQQTIKAQMNQEEFRPSFHFTPAKGWMNDPNGMVYFDKVYHLFFQYNPDSTVWGPMHWGHAVSTDLFKWKELPIALYPDSIGTIFSGSAVIDSNNTAGFGKDAMVAIFTQHNHELENQHSNIFQNQSIAYSLDKGKTWKKYEGNPVLKNPGIKDFRDPKVFWYAPEKKWIMTLATLDHITFYSSPNLKDWTQESEFGKTIGAHGGVWECPDLFALDYKGKKVWVLIVNLNPGGPNQGSATQYFTGNFDGKVFTPDHTNIKWLDYGPDEYAGVNWDNTGNRTIFLGWMSNWEYAQQVPTKSWRSAMTIPRELSLENINNQYLVVSTPVKEINSYFDKGKSKSNISVVKSWDITKKLGKIDGEFQLSLKDVPAEDFKLIFSNKKGETIIVGYKKETHQFYIDRTNSGITDFSKNFPGVHYAPRFLNHKDLDLVLIFDKTSVELFADNGLTTMTSIFFPQAPLSNIKIEVANPTQIKQVELKKFKKANN